MRIRHKRSVFELGESVPLIIPHTENLLDSDCESQLFFTFNCTSPCLVSQLLARVECASRPLILVSSVFFIKRTGELVRPVRELTRNILISVADIPRNLPIAPSSSATGTVAGSSTGPKPESPEYRPPSPDYQPSSPMYEPSASPFAPATPSPVYQPNLLPDTSGTSTRATSSRRGRRASKRKADRHVRFN